MLPGADAIRQDLPHLGRWLVAGKQKMGQIIHACTTGRVAGPRSSKRGSSVARSDLRAVRHHLDGMPAERNRRGVPVPARMCMHQD